MLALVRTLTRNQPPTAGYRAVNDWRTCETAASALGFAATIATNTSVAYRPYFGCCFLYATTTTLYSNPLMTQVCTLVNACAKTPPLLTEPSIDHAPHTHLPPKPFVATSRCVPADATLQLADSLFDSPSTGSGVRVTVGPAAPSADRVLDTPSTYSLVGPTTPTRAGSCVPNTNCVESAAATSTFTMVGQDPYVLTTAADGTGMACTGSSML